MPTCAQLTALAAEAAALAKRHDVFQQRLLALSTAATAAAEARGSAEAAHADAAAAAAAFDPAQAAQDFAEIHTLHTEIVAAEAAAARDRRECEYVSQVTAAKAAELAELELATAAAKGRLDKEQGAFAEGMGLFQSFWENLGGPPHEPVERVAEEPVRSAAGFVVEVRWVPADLPSADLKTWIRTATAAPFEEVPSTEFHKTVRLTFAQPAGAAHAYQALDNKVLIAGRAPTVAYYFAEATAK